MPVATALTPAQDAQARQIGGNLRCPTCTGLPITESGDALSIQMRREVRDQVKASQSERDIYGLMVARYGSATLLKPPKQGLNLVVWATPLLALGAGAVHFWRTFRFQQTRREPGTATDPYLAQVRQEAGSRKSGDS
ncbi:cytochrome c-type biogenesis protein CcmH [Deinococcus sp. 14RED07]|uniref:cytochrome c-type biogenesis protein n=1 Tax=unclassified Deinococcus TaxID=2623546 RepID=UPI002104A7E7|nr:MULTISPECIES: cytochrome c-type biogenesis protein CcmH [unclassified Deinococcus]MCD0159836.1 cytochrome c-type biogenesis protein CcmH [Deinococcus sp. 6YEL10]MCD0164072.1 cytochrome c-type biogenesis protein CcmH [Deinococcus sp. 12RED42]MCD0174627.1 cytochrome c-type biogenesis protein CcmH [Deinococcus sp. 14RED07]